VVWEVVNRVRRFINVNRSPKSYISIRICFKDVILLVIVTNPENQKPVQVIRGLYYKSIAFLSMNIVLSHQIASQAVGLKD
jgi:hypothetical protein